MKKEKTAIILAALLLVLALIWGFLPGPVEVELFAAVRAPLAVTVEEEGKTRVMERYLVSAPLSGYLRRPALKAGEAVAAGEVLAVLEPGRSEALDPRSRAQAEARASAAGQSLASARESARAAQAEAELAASQLARVEKLAAGQFYSPQAVDQARSARDRAQAAYRAASHEIRVAEFQLENTRAALVRTAGMQSGAGGDDLAVRAPSAGRVLKLIRESAGAVRAGEALIEVGDPAGLEVEVDVLSSSAVRIPPGGRVVLEGWGGPALEGRVRRVEPGGFTKVSALGVEEQRVKVIVDLISPKESWQRLGDGYRVEARFILWQGEALQVPASAVFRHGEGWAAYVAEGGRARLRAVRTGHASGLRVQILEGLKPGEKVIERPGEQIRDGSRITQREPAGH